MNEMIRKYRMAAVRLSGLVFLVLLLAWYLKPKIKDFQLDTLELKVNSRQLTVHAPEPGGPAVLQGLLGMTLAPMSPPPVPCSSSLSENNGACFLSSDVARLSIMSKHYKENNVQCYNVRWESLTRDHQPMDCFSLTDAHWYGGSEVYIQHWPINEQRVPMQQFRSFDYLMSKEGHSNHGPVVEPYWLNSRGVAIFVDDDRVPLHVGFNQDGDGRLCLSASFAGTTTAWYGTQKFPELSYNVCQAENAKAIHSFVARYILDHPSSLPDERVIRYPIWSTWARFKTKVNQEGVLQFADELEKYGFKHSQIEIDDMYTTAYGELDFDTRKFPDAKTMVDQLHSRGFRVTSWVIPFANLDSKAFTDGLARNYWLTDAKGTVPALVKWWQGTGAVLDATNPEAVKWFVVRLESFKRSTGIDSFKFDAGEVGHLPPHVGSYVSLENPNQYTTYYAELVARLGGMAEMRSAYRSQKHAIFTRIMDKDSTWGTENGLETLIPTALCLSMAGYHYILPDMIGGNGYNPNDGFGGTTIPDRELYIRWVQATTYLPSMQFSFTPWQYDDEVVQISRAAALVHEQRATTSFFMAAKEMIESGTPIIRPVWWVDPDDQAALEVRQQFMVGNEVLVAPIVHKGARERDIYLPRGTWKDLLRTTVIMGGQWLRQYHVDLHELAAFVKLRTADDTE